MAGTNIPDTAGRKSRRSRKTQAIAKRYALNANTGIDNTAHLVKF